MNPVHIVLVCFIVIVSASPLISNRKDNQHHVLLVAEPKYNALENNSSTEAYKNVLHIPFTGPYVGPRMIKPKQFDSNDVVEGRKKSKLKKLKKIFLPIIIFVLVKALVFIPMALFILSFKAWNAIQLSFVSFVAAAAVAVWKFCTKVNQDVSPPLIHAGPDLDGIDPHLLAYNGYVPY
ncbi:unnamed protein product [Phyllotreta striolata]|uniref:Uncharacterized protein n=1 Tax=Phyllotreta striolata TaxID=444603 RepID=A0A9N9XSU2_PHYSR|nr:unnamed protein product [Phyllotreta striolata]